MNPTPGVIRTPDQRIRVFISSTLKELAPERRMTRAAVERLHLAPVMFELGARPHPPRELYRAYLQQSDVFVGIYGESYGWVAPDEAVSGLEDEYNLATALPKLIYIRESATAREERLTGLLARVRDDDRASFKYFSTPQELRKLIEADLATLLAERFDQSREPLVAEPSSAPRGERSTIPAPLTGLIGRERELDTVEALLARDSVRMVSLIGPGGIGKSRIAAAVAGRERDRGGNREVVFVDLTPVQDPALVPNLIAQALGVLDTGDEAVFDKLKTALRERNALIVVDNFEQVLSAATTLTALLAAAPGVTFLVTSRTLLRVSGEHAVEIGPLELPGQGGEAIPASVALFVERARAVKPDFELNPGNAAAVTAICVALDGVPLALELAAARIRMLTPEAMLARLDKRLALLAGGARDLPARQQTLRSTIEWSTQLLGRDEKRLLGRLGVFSGGFSLEAMEAVASSDDGTDPVTELGALVDNSMVREEDRGGQPRFSMLATVREYALEQLEESGALAATRAAHADYFSGFAKSLELDLEGAGLREAIDLLNADRENLRATARCYLDSGDYDAVAELTWTLLIYWWVGGLLGEVRGWMEEVLAAPGADGGLNDRTRAIALYFTRSIRLWHDSTEAVVAGLTESVELFHRVGERHGEGMALIFLGLAGLGDKPPDPARAARALNASLDVLRSVGDDWGEGMALVTLGRVSLMKRALHEAIDHFEASLALARTRRDDLGTAIALHHLGWATMVKGDKDKARELFEESLATAARLGHAEGVAYGLEGLTAIAAAERDVGRAGRLLRASEALRNQTGLHSATRFSFHEHYLAPILAGEHAEELERVRTDGRDLSMDEAVRFALDGNQELAGLAGVPQSG